MPYSAIQCKSSAIELPEVKGEQHLPFCTSLVDQTGIAKTLACPPGAKEQKVYHKRGSDKGYILGSVKNPQPWSCQKVMGSTQGSHSQILMAMRGVGGGPTEVHIFYTQKITTSASTSLLLLVYPPKSLQLVLFSRPKKIPLFL